MKKRPEEFDDEFIDDEEILDDEEFLDDEEILDDEEFLDDEEEDIEDEPKKKKAKKLDKKGGKKGGKKGKLSKGAKIGIIISSVIAGLAIIAVLGVYVILPLVMPSTEAASDFQALLAVNGYQNYEAANAAVADVNSGKRLRSDAPYKKIYSVDEMLASGDVNQNNKAQFAAALYSLAITNYAAINGTGWYCYTDSKVFADGVQAKLGISFESDKFEVSLRAAYGLGNEEAVNNTNKDQSTEKKDNYFSQTVSGVTELNIQGLPSNLTSSVKGAFGYNMQEYLYDGVVCFRRGPNGGAKFYGKEKGAKYMMGAYNAKFPTSYKKGTLKDDGFPIGTYNLDKYSTKKYGATKSLEVLEDESVKNMTKKYGATTAWGKIDQRCDYGFTIEPAGVKEAYYIGDYGAGWATYNFSEEFIDAANTTIEHDTKNHVYIINLAVKADKADEACVFAKGSLTKDTKDYIQMQTPTYSLSKNEIHIYENGLIAYWEREETVASTKEAKLTVFEGKCTGGGGTTNHTYMAFSYSAIDYSPKALAARYMSEIGSTDAGFPADYVQDLSGWPTLEEYDPFTKQAEYIKLK